MKRAACFGDEYRSVRYVAQRESGDHQLAVVAGDRERAGRAGCSAGHAQHPASRLGRSGRAEGTACGPEPRGRAAAGRVRDLG